MNRAENNRALPSHDTRLLRGFEKIAVPLMRLNNGVRWFKRAATFWAFLAPARIVRVVTGPAWVIHNQNRVNDLEIDEGVLLISNHRSFFDMYVIGSLLRRDTKLMQTLFFPVRSPFWYTSLVGVLVNMLMSGGAMWPPIFRDRRSLELNPVSMEQLAYVLRLRGTVIGFHPEGTRNQSLDPFNFLRAKTGLGRLVAGASENATIIPIYINGLSNSFWGELTRNMPVIGRDVGPIRIVFGEPIRVGDLPSDLAPRRLSDMLMDKIEELAKEDPAHPEHLA